MRIVTISDTHCQHRKLNIPDGDIIIHSGDACGWGSINEMTDFFQWFQFLPHTYKIFVPGNHDKTAESAIFKTLVPSGVITLIDEETTINGLKIYGSPWTPTFSHGWAFNRDRGVALRKTWEQIPPDTNILITHGPPFGILDLVGGRPPSNEGCKELKYRIAGLKDLKVHIFGHIHREKYLMEQTEVIGNTTFINASILDEEYKIKNNPVVIDI